jgi:hypothetical protein
MWHKHITTARVFRAGYERAAKAAHEAGMDLDADCIEL